MSGDLVVRLLATLRALAEAMNPLRGHLRFTDEQDAALQDACELIVELETDQ